MLSLNRAWKDSIPALSYEVKANPYGYAGYTYDKEIQQYYLMARYYEPAQGVFTAIDPDPGDDDDPQTMNGYNYANNNPVMFVDPDGHWVWLAVGGAFGAYSGYKHAKKRGYKGWRMAASIVGGGALGAVTGGKSKVAYRVFKYGRKLRLRNITKSTSRFKNYRANISRRQLGNRLKKNGWKQGKRYTTPAGVKGRSYTKKGRVINIRNKSKSNGATADYYRKSRPKHKTKFRLRR